MRRVLVQSLFLLLTVAAFGSAGIRQRGKIDFSGNYQFNAKLSKLQILEPESGIFRVQHQEPEVHISRTFVQGGKEDLWSIRLTTDGKEVVQKTENRVSSSRLHWEGTDLMLEQTITMGDRQATNTVRYHLSEDGKTLTAKESFRGPVLRYDNLWVLEKR